ncbi:MAG: hypothetical protein QM718_04500 [Steroidobacteraceae bacterium]
MRYAILSLLLVLTACSRDAGPQSAAGSTVAGVATQVRAAGEDWVAAVSSAKIRTPIDLKFRLKQRPRIDQPLEIELALDVDERSQVQRIVLNFSGLTGLDVVSDARLSIEQPEGGTQVKTLVVMPRKSGVYYVTATAIVDGGALSISRVYSIPVIVPEAAG